MSVRFDANSANEIGIYVADADTPDTPVTSATVTVTLSLEGVAVVSGRSTSTYVSTLAFPSGRKGGYLLAFTAAEISAAGRQYRALITVTISGTQVEQLTLLIPCFDNVG